MGSRNESEYVGRRAELLAKLVLTRRPGVSVFPFDSADIGIDLVAHLPAIRVPGLEKPIQPSLGVVVKGTSSKLEREEDANSHARKAWKPLSENPLILSPVAVLLFSMEGDHGFSSWLMEPRLNGKGPPGLEFVEAPDMIKVTRKRIDGMFDKVESWYSLMAQVVLCHAT
jgi:hypothetical protein